MQKGHSIVCACVLAALFSASTSAQSVVLQPTTVEFAPSVDHAAMEADGTTPVITRYDLLVYTEADLATPVATLSLGKPTPVEGKISVSNPVWFAALTPRTRYVARVASVGTGGSGASELSNPFGVAGPPSAAPPPILIR